MGGPAEIQLYARSGLDPTCVAARAEAEVRRLEQKYSRYRDDSEATRINRSAGDPRGVEVDAETAHLLDYAATCWQQSEGLFDVTSGVLRRAWDFKSGRVPGQAEIDAVLPQVGWRRVRWQRPRLVLPVAGMEIDFGGYVKEYAADRAAELCRRLGARHGLVDLAGDLSLVGAHPDGAPWNVGVRDPGRRGEALASVRLDRGAIASSGDYERCLVASDGRRYGHILDPRTGWPVESGFAHVSVVASHCLIAGTASTVAMLKGARDGASWLEALGLPHVCVTPEGLMAGTLAA